MRAGCVNSSGNGDKSIIMGSDVAIAAATCCSSSSCSSSSCSSCSTLTPEAGRRWSSTAGDRDGREGRVGGGNRCWCGCGCGDGGANQAPPYGRIQSVDGMVVRSQWGFTAVVVVPVVVPSSASLSSRHNCDRPAPSMEPSGRCGTDRKCQ